MLHGRKHTRDKAGRQVAEDACTKRVDSQARDGAGRKVIAKQDEAQDACTRRDDNRAANGAKRMHTSV